MLQREIPIYRIPWDIARPVHCGIDLVHHGGSEPRGQYGYTRQVIDVPTGRSGRRAMLGRSYVVVADAFLTLSEQFPFRIRELHVDNGGKSLNVQLLRFLKQLYSTVTRSRSALGRPNGNRYVCTTGLRHARAHVRRRLLSQYDDPDSLSQCTL